MFDPKMSAEEAFRLALFDAETEPLDGLEKASEMLAKAIAEARA